MSAKNRNLRKKIAEETVKIIEKGYYNCPNKVDISELVNNCVTNAILYKPDVQHVLPESPGLPGIIEVTGESTFAAAIRLVTQLNIENTACLNFASAKHPGGGFLKGSSAQEESLARQSALYYSIKQMDEMYDYNTGNRTLLYSDYMIYSPKVPIFRDDHDKLLAEPVCVSIITAPAVNLSRWNESLDEPHRVMTNRIRKIIQVAILNNNRSIVLGAYGCGVFKNDPYNVAQYFKTILIDENLRSYFDRIIFAVIGSASKNYDAFEQVFEQYKQ